MRQPWFRRSIGACCCSRIGISFATGILFGLFPAVHVSRVDVNSSLKDTSGRAGTGRHQNVARGVLVVSEIALALVLLVGAALLIRTFVGLRTVNPGFDPHNILTMQISLAGARYATTAQVDNLIRQVTPRLESLPGVQSAASSIMLPIEGGVDLPFNIAGKPPAKGDQYNGDEQWRSISAHYFSAFKIPVLRGRDVQRTRHRTIVASGHHQSDDGQEVLAQRGSDRASDHNW